MSQVWKDEDGLRVFSLDTDSEELEWHVDFEDREVTIINGGGWKIQIDNQLPRTISDGDTYFIKKYFWHRIIKGHSELKLRVVNISV